MKKIFSGVVTAMLVLSLALADAAGGFSALPAAAAADTPSIMLNGTVAEGDAGFINSKSVILSTGTETKVNYRLVPGYASGTATGVRATIFMPSLEHNGSDYVVVGRDSAPTPLGVQGRVSAGAGWNVISDTTVQGGPIVMEYDGDLGAGTNPAFDIFLTTYNDGTDGVYGSVPEGTRFELSGYVKYDMFNRVLGSTWESPNQMDDESRVSVISSDLTWESTIESYVVPEGSSDLVPIWDRYQYIDYEYLLENTSTNRASNIDGYSVTFDIDSTDSMANGIIPFDINRWTYVEGQDPVPNTKPADTSGQFVGVPGQGGILIYDVTEWDGVSELTEEIPYIYSGTGMIEIDRMNGDNKQGLTPDGADGPTERKFRVSLPLSRQGFPNPPAMFKVKAITNILFAKTANWSKTRVVEREIAAPTYAFDFSHTTKQSDVVYGYETYNEISELRSDSNAPTFTPTVDYVVDEDFVLDRVTYEFDESHFDKFEHAEIGYSYVDKDSGDTVSETLTTYDEKRDDTTGVVTLTFDVSHLKVLDWDQKLTFSLVDRVEAHSTIPVSIKVFGAPYRVGTMVSTATAAFIEKIASNDDFGENTTYTEVRHETEIDTEFNVIYPDEVIPTIKVSIDGKGDTAVVPYQAVTMLDFLFGVNDTIAANSTTTLELNKTSETLKGAKLFLKEALFQQAENVRVKYETLDGDVVNISLKTYSGTGDFTFDLPKRVAKVIIDTDVLASNGPVNFASVSATVGNKLDKEHLVTVDIRTYQPKPYDKDATAKATGTIKIQLPNELVPAVDIVGVYGSLKTQNSTNVSYESRFEAEYKLNTRGVNSPSTEYVIDMLAPTKSGALVFKKLTLQEIFLDNVTDPTVTFVDKAGIEQEFTKDVISAGEVTLQDFVQIVISGENLQLKDLSAIAIVEYDADIEMGSSQTLRATFTGSQEDPYDDTKTASKTNKINVSDTKTGVKVEGVNQVTQQLGAGNKYSVDIYRWWNRGYTYNKQDYTLDQGYKSLGGFTSTLTRPTATYDNNDQHVSVNVDLPYEHFDLYYLKIRADMKDYIDTVDVYRMVDGKEELWKSIPGSEWVENSQEGANFWRIATARPDMADEDLFKTYEFVNAGPNHPYYKKAWDADVRPESPVSRVDIQLEFTRDSNDDRPQMSGVHDDIVEYMGRFHSSSEKGKKDTELKSTDTFGKRNPVTAESETSIKSLVAYPFAQTRTGANDNTSLARKVITMGNVGEYLASIWNVNAASWPYYSDHGPDIYVPANTEYDEWLGMYDPSSFHDKLVYEFVYPASPKQDAIYNLDAKHFIVADTSTLKYMTGVEVFGDGGETVSIQFPQTLTAAARFDYDNADSRGEGIHNDGDGSFTVSFGEDGGYPKNLEITFEEVAGFGERTAEILGAAEDKLGINLNEVDVRVGGVVNGNRDLIGTTKLHRIPADTNEKTLMHTTSAILQGYTPKLGAELHMKFVDGVKVYDFQADGVTPNTTQVALGIKNSSEADIKDVVINFEPDTAFRSQLIEIPAEIFKDRDWSVKSVVVTQGKGSGNTDVEIDLDLFVLNQATGNYELNLLPLFADGTLRTDNTDVTFGGAATLLKMHVDNISVKFTPKDHTVRLWGSLAIKDNPTENLPVRMHGDDDLFVTGVWVDEDAPYVDAANNGHNWNSKPSFVTNVNRDRPDINEQIRHHSSFKVNAEVTSYNPIYVSAGTGNNGQKPSLTLTSSTSYANAPRLYNRVARLQTHAVHLQNNYTVADSTDLFYDADTGAQINYSNIAVGDTTKVLYELRNIGQTAAGDRAPGSLPVFDPLAHIEVPAGLEISDVQAWSEAELTDPAIDVVIDGISTTPVRVPAGDVEIVEHNNKRADVFFDVTLGHNESVFFYVEYTAVNDYNPADPKLGDTQGKTLQWNVYSRPDYAHHYMSYDSNGVDGNRVHGTTATINFDKDQAGVSEHLGRIYNTNYKYAAPSKLELTSQFVTENVSGQDMTLNVSNAFNEIRHNNTLLDVFVTLDTNSLRAKPVSGFELIQFPSPKYPAGFDGEFDDPKVYFETSTDTWVLKEDYDPAIHSLGSITKLRVEYGNVPAGFGPADFLIKGKGHWKTIGADTTKSYAINSQAQIKLTHWDQDKEAVAEYSYATGASSTVWKAIPQVEFNLQSFDRTGDTGLDQLPVYDGNDVGKTNYLPGDKILYRLTAKNRNSLPSTNTKSPYGKAPLLKPVIFDKIPQYLAADELMAYVSGGVLDVEQAVAHGALSIRLLDANGVPRPFKLPTATVRQEFGFDIGGAQQFANDSHNDGKGLLSKTEPVDPGKNPANKISFEVVTYSFEEEDLGRGEQLEIVYAAQAATEGLPVATYTNGQAVYAPLFGWYKNNYPVADSAKDVAMDMASLLHDAGISGNRGHEMTDEEFLSNSFSWQPGSDQKRLVAGSYYAQQDTFYDETANKQKTQPSYLNEPAANAGIATNDLYTSFTSGVLEDNYKFAAKGRVNDGAVPFAERILWAQDGMQLNRAWLYGASEMVPEKKRNAWGVDEANFYERDFNPITSPGSKNSLNSYNRQRNSYTPYVEDNYSYAVQLHEEFTVKLHAANLGDRSIESGLEYTEILPLGVSPLGEDGNWLGVQAFDGAGAPIAESDFEYEILQTPEEFKGYSAPAQSQEAGTYSEDTRDDMIPYVVQVRVKGEVESLFNALGSSDTDKYQSVEITARVFEEVAPSIDGLSYWHDEFTLTTLGVEEYLEIYGTEREPSEVGKPRKGYGAYHQAISTWNTDKFPNDGMPTGIDVNNLTYYLGNGYTSQVSVEPWGKYVRGLNAQATVAKKDQKPALVTGDQLTMRKPTLRVWSTTTKQNYDVVKDSSGVAYDSTIQDFNVDLYERFTLNSIVENQQLEVLDEYNRASSGYNYYSGDNFNADVWENAPQTIGGARGSWFEPTVSIALPYGIAPVQKDGSYSRYHAELKDVQDVDFTATVKSVSLNPLASERDLTEFFDVEVQVVEEANGKRFVLHFTANDEKAASIAYGESLVISPEVVTIDTPLTGANEDDSKYREALTLANSKRPVFNPIVSALYQTGSVPSVTAKDLGLTYPNNVKPVKGTSITANDRKRPDSTSTWNTNFGVLKISERLISATKDYTGKTPVLQDSEGEEILAKVVTPGKLAAKHEKAGAYGGTTLNLKRPSITNVTKAANYADSFESDDIQVDAAGKYWYSTQVTNSPTPAATKNPYDEIKTAGDVHNSRFVVTQFVTNFAEVTGEVRIKLGDEVLGKDEFEAKGYKVAQRSPSETAADPLRNRIQWVVTTPANERGTYGQLKSGESFKFLYEVQLKRGYEDQVDPGGDVWSAEELTAHSYVSLISDDDSLIAGGQDPRDFIVQSLKSITYHSHASDAGEGQDVDNDGTMDGLYAADTTKIEILKPKAEVRVNTTRPRIAYSNGQAGDTYFNSSDTIEYLVTHAEITGSGLKEMVVEHVLPTDETNDSSVPVSNGKIKKTTTRYVSTGKWDFPQETLDRIEADGVSIDDAFRTYVYISGETAEEGYEGGDWKPLNLAGASTGENVMLQIPVEHRVDLKKIRIVVQALKPNEYLVPKGLSLAVDADADADGKQTVLETDPTNLGTEPFPETVTDNAIKLGLLVESDVTSTLFVYGTAQIWGNYVGDSVTKLAQSQTRSYLTPSRPVVNVKYDSLYYRSDLTQPLDQRFGWSDVTAIAPKSSPHMKFRGEFINADESMWSRDEDNIYAEDTLVDPFVTFQLPTVMESGGVFTHVPSTKIDAGHPLSDKHRSQHSLTSKENNLWTWKLVGADGSAPNEDSNITDFELYAGPWSGVDRNVVSVWFKGTVFPGDMIVVEFIGSVDAYSPGADAQDLKSRAMITNNTGLLHPLNSRMNSSNYLGYLTDSNDLNDDAKRNDRLVFSEKSLFQYEIYDDFGKRKVSYSDLNRAGTVAPELTPVRQGGEFSFEVSVDNSKEAGSGAYPYPIFYDVLPFLGDTSIRRSEVARGSQYSAWLQADGMNLERDGADKKTYSAGEYTVFVGPFTKQAGQIVETDMVPHADAASESFYDALGLPGVASATRDKHFVKLDELKNDPELLKKAKSILVLFNDPKEQLPGQNKLKFTYTMKAPHNAPAFLEQFDEQEKLESTSLWNSFMATQRVSSFVPQESNNAGAFVTEKPENVYIGNYVWNDVNYNGAQDEGDPFVDENGRTHLKPSFDLNHDGTTGDDPGINGVEVTLLTANGYNVDVLGNPIHKVGNAWEIVDEATGKSVLDEVFSQPIVSEGPLVTVTESDFYGNAGYYTFSNIKPGNYRVMFEFPQVYDSFLTTTTDVFKNSAVQVFERGEKLDIPAAVDDSVLVAITDAAEVDSVTTDAERMSFDLGVAETILVGGTIFEEQIDTLDGYQAGAGEDGLEGYHVYLKRMNGDTALDVHGNPMVTTTNAQGKYEFTLLPVDRQYYVQVTDRDDRFNTEWLVSPFVHNADPFALANDNDGVNEKGTKVVKTHVLEFDLEGLFLSDFADRKSVSVGFYKKSTFGVIGNRVWDDLNRNGIQEEGEPGLAGQELHLEQYTRVGGEWARTNYEQTAVSNVDGYYYFTKVPSTLYDGDVPIETKYQVVVKKLVTGYTFAPTNAPAASGVVDATLDSDFFKNGTMHEVAAVGDRLVSVVEIDPDTGVVFGVTDNTVDLGLVGHARSSLSGEIFTDTDRNGIRDDADAAERIYTATLEVLVEGAWVDAKQGADGMMVEPVHVTASDTSIQQVGVSRYKFENLHIIDNLALTPYEYRVRMSQIPLWQEVTKLNAGDDTSIDSDFIQAARDSANTAVSEAPRIIGQLQDQLLPVETFTGVPAEHVDLGLFNLKTQATIGDFIWNDENGDGVQGADESGVEGLRIALNRVVGGELIYVAETTTDADGKYEFTVDVADYDPDSVRFNLPHEYVVEFEMTSRQSLSPLKIGDDSTNSKFVNLVAGGIALYAHQIGDPAHTAVSEVATLAELDANGFADYSSSAERYEIDGGIITHDTVRVLGDTVYEDINADGAQGADEPGISGLGVSVFKLNRETGLWESYTDTEGRSSTTTNADGTYWFAVEVADLEKTSAHYRQAEEYRVLIDAPANLRLVEINNVFFYQASNNVDGIPVAKPYSYVLTEAISLVESDAEGVILTTARDVFTADAGFARYADSVTIGGTIWEDTDFDGLQSAGEEGTEGAEGEAGIDTVPAEVGILGRTVVLWEWIDGAWEQAKDVNGNSTALTDDDGSYSFEVSPAQYDEAAPNFLAPRQYRVTTERDGYQAWSPFNVGDDRAIDSDISAAGPDDGTAHTGVTQVFSIVDHDGTTVDVTSVRDDLRMDIGLKTYKHQATIGGTVWIDANEDGEQDAREGVLADRLVTLWEFVEDEWQIVADLNGNSTQASDENGYYEFEVSPTDYDEFSDGYLMPREYRTTIAVPAGYLLSGGSAGAYLEGQIVLSLSANISTFNEEGLIDITAVQDDLTFGFPFVKIPANALSNTGAIVNFGLPAAALILGLALVLLGMRRQREQKTREAA